NSSGNLVTFDGTQAHNLTDIASLNDAPQGRINLQNITSQVALDLTGPVDSLALNYAAGVSLNGTQQLNLTNAVKYAGTEINFAAGAQAGLDVSLTGSSTVKIEDDSLTKIVATTATGTTPGSNSLEFNDAGNHKILAADFTGVGGA